MKKAKNKLAERILKNPAAYVCRFNFIETARKVRRKLRGHLIVKVGGQYWLACGKYAGALRAAGFEYAR